MNSEDADNPELSELISTITDRIRTSYSGRDPQNEEFSYDTIGFLRESGIPVEAQTPYRSLIRAVNLVSGEVAIQMVNSVRPDLRDFILTFAEDKSSQTVIPNYIEEVVRHQLFQAILRNSSIIEEYKSFAGI